MSLLSRLSLANRSVVALASIALILFGLFVIPLLKQELLPPLTNPAISILTTYPGATPLQVEQDITTPLEQAIGGAPNIQETASQSSEGFSLVTVLYNFGINLDQAQQQLTAQIQKAQPSLPTNVTPQVQTVNVSDLPIITLAVTSSQAQQDLGVALKKVVVPALQGINGVSAVTVTGVRQPVVTVALNLKKLQEKGISVVQVQNALQANNLTLPAGEVTSNGQTFAIRVGNTLTSLQALRNLVVGVQQPAPGISNPSPGSAPSSLQQAPTPVRLSDVATVQEELAPSSTLTRMNGKPSLGIDITKAADGNTVAISQSLRAQLPDLEKKLGDHTQITVVDDQAPAIQTAIADLAREGVLGAGFAILVILVFLLSLRSTLVTAISIPLSVIIALIALWTQQYSLNIMTLSGLTIAIGRVVDDSIVVLENIYRHLRLGETKRTAVLTGVHEVAKAVTASTLTTVAVFLPLAFLGGIVGEYTHPLAFTVTCALLASLFVALTVIPVFAYWLLKAPGRVDVQQPPSEKPNVLERVYTPLIRWVTGHRIITVLLALLLLIGAFALFPLLPSNAFGSQGGKSFSFTQQLPPTTSLARTDQAARQVEAVLMGTPGIQTYEVIIGTNNASFSSAGGANVASFIVTVKPGSDTATVQQTVRDHLKHLATIGTVTFQDQLNTTVDVTVQAPDDQTLRQAAELAFAVVKQTPDTTNATSDLANAVPFIDVQVDPGNASLHGLTSLQVGQVLQAVYTGSRATQVVLNGVQQDVDLKLDAEAVTVQQMQNLLIPGPLGTVRLGEVATITLVSGPVQIAHINGIRSATITLTVTSQNVGGVTQAIQNRLARLPLPHGARATLGGNATGAQDALTQLYLALLFAIPVVFMVMVVTFRSLIQPLILLVSIPFAAVGSIVLAVLTQTAISVSSLFGFLMLIGIVVTNAIVLIDRVNHFRAEGMDARAAVIAGGRQRVRPILMTAAATMMALLPMAVSGSGNAIIASSLAIVVIGGLASSTLLTLLLVPTLYLMVEQTRDRFRKKQDVSSMQTGEHVVL